MVICTKYNLNGCKPMHDIIDQPQTTQMHCPPQQPLQLQRRQRGRLCPHPPAPVAGQLLLHWR